LNLIVISPGYTGRLMAGWVRLHGTTYLSVDTPEELPQGAIAVELNEGHRGMVAHWLAVAVNPILRRAYNYAHNEWTGSKLPSNLIKQLRCIAAATLDKDTARAVDFYLALGAPPDPVKRPPRREPIRVKKRTDDARMYILGLTAEDSPSTLAGEE
jgi:hypothetical protein